MMEFEMVKAKTKASDYEGMLSQIEPGMAARIEKDPATVISLRAYIWRYKEKYPDFYTYTDEEFFYIARKGAE